MTSLSQLLLSSRPLIAVSFDDRVTDSTIAMAPAEGLDIAEIRVDLFDNVESEHVVAQVERFAALPSIATIRSHAEGGAWRRPSSLKLELFRKIMHAVDAVDVELSASDIAASVVTEAHDQGRMAIVSFHDFNGTPPLPDLNRIVADAKQIGADLVKVCTMAASAGDVQTLARFTLENQSAGLISIAMGSEGVISRALFPVLGSRITYASIGARTAPGQMSFEDTFRHLRMFYPEFNREKIRQSQLVEDA